jgi:hypothetical protein
MSMNEAPTYAIRGDMIVKDRRWVLDVFTRCLVMYMSVYRVSRRPDDADATLPRSKGSFAVTRR